MKAWVVAAVVAGCLGMGRAGRAPIAEASDRWHDDPDVRIVKAPEAGLNKWYGGNRAPLAPCPLAKLPIGAIEPRGWLRGQLELMRDGMTGHLEEVSHWVKPDGNAWLSKEGKGENGWEELPYWLKGVGDLGYVLRDERLTALARRWCEGVTAAQREDGYFGSEENRGGGPENMQLGVAGKLKGPDLWPHMPLLDALKSHYEAGEGGAIPGQRAGDPRVLAFLEKYFRWEAALPKDQLLAGSWQKIRGGDNLESVLWLYNRLGGREQDRWLLNLAKTLHENTAPWREKIASWHGVNICQGFREPGVWWQVSKEATDLEAVERNYQEVMGKYGQVPGGMFGADENCREGKGDPRQAAETCSMVEFMNSFEQMLGITGEGVWADRCEEVAFNSLPAAFAADYRGLHYLTAPNMVQLDRGSKAPGLQNGGTMVSYDPGEAYRCCQHNHGMGWPYFAEHLWMATGDGGLAAVMYSECEVRAKVGDGAEVTLTEDTAYPFDERVVVRVKTERPVRFPLYLRVPGWARPTGFAVQDKGGTYVVPPGELSGDEEGVVEYARIEREWADGDVIGIRFSAPPRVKKWEANKGAASVKRGALWYSLKIGERSVPYGEGAWRGTEVFPTTAWNYGLVLGSEAPEEGLKVVTRAGAVPRQPWTVESVPVAIEANARKVPAWQSDRTGLVRELQESPVKSGEPEETVTLIPMGAARLRISSFPVIGEGPGSREWTAPTPARHAASYEYDDIEALSDGKVPANSNDHSIPRFTWWDHLGTKEWVSWKFERPRRASSCAVYWFDDSGVGRCRVPESWRVMYQDGGEWREVKGARAYGVERDRFNQATFEPVETGELRLEVKLREGFSGGILEWRVE
jgi:hypothetical protein